MPIFKPGPGPFALHQSMVGVKMGDRVLQVGCGDGRHLAVLAGKVGLTGRACGVAPDEPAATVARTAAAKAGVLVEIEVARFDAHTAGGEFVNMFVASLPVAGVVSAGEHTVEWNGRDRAGNLPPSGADLCRLESACRAVPRRGMMVR